MNARLSQLGSAFVERASTDLLLTLSEGFLKIRLMEAALSLGWRLQEGAGSTPNGSIADFVTLDSGELNWNRATRILSLDGGSSDLAVVSPFEMLMEIKARPDFGTKSQAQFHEMELDVDRVANTRGCALAFVFDPKIYLSFSGEKRETRGRPPKAHHWFNEHFPRRNDIPLGDFHHTGAERGDAKLKLLFTRFGPSAGGQRVLCLGSRSDATF